MQFGGREEDSDKKGDKSRPGESTKEQRRMFRFKERK